MELFYNSTVLITHNCLCLSNLTELSTQKSKLYRYKLCPNKSKKKVKKNETDYLPVKLMFNIKDLNLPLIKSFNFSPSIKL